MVSVASQLIEEVTPRAKKDSLEDAREICADGSYFPNNLHRNHLRQRGWWSLPDVVTRIKSAAFMSPCRISRFGGRWVSQSFDDEVTDRLENSPITTRLMAWEDARFIEPRVKASGSLLKLSSVVLSDVLNSLCLSVQIDWTASGFCFQACFPIVYTLHFIPMYRTFGMWVKSQPGSKQRKVDRLAHAHSDTLSALPSWTFTVFLFSMVLLCLCILNMPLRKENTQTLIELLHMNKHPDIVCRRNISISYIFLKEMLKEMCLVAHITRALFFFPLWIFILLGITRLALPFVSRFVIYDA
jgi:hypothetical protein